MQQPQTFASRGYTVFRETVPVATVNELRNLARYSNDLVWYSTVRDVEEGRIQAALPDELARSLSTEYKRHYKTFFPTAHPNDWRFLKIVAGGSDQPPRREFKSEDDVLNPCSVPGSIMVATEDETFIYGFGWNQQIPFRSSRKLIELSKGDIILFRGDFIHAPVGYRSNNLCLQAYLDVPNYDRAQCHVPRVLDMVDDTVINDDPFCYVSHCEFCSTGARSMGKHINRFHCFKFKAPSRALEE